MSSPCVSAPDPLTGAAARGHGGRLLFLGHAYPHRRGAFNGGAPLFTITGRILVAVGFRVVRRRSDVCMSRCAVPQPGSYDGPRAGRCRCRQWTMMFVIDRPKPLPAMMFVIAETGYRHLPPAPAI